MNDKERTYMLIRDSDPDFHLYRPNVGMIVLNAQNQVFVAQRIDAEKTAWQLPQGGIDEGEDISSAALRELEEETSMTSVHPLTMLPGADEWLYYDLPLHLQQTLWEGAFKGQRQKWIVMTFSGDDKEINLETAHPEFSAWRWVDSQALPDLAVSFKQDIYRYLSLSLNDGAVDSQI